MNLEDEEVEKEKWAFLKKEEIIIYDEDIECELDVVRKVHENLKTSYYFYILFIEEEFIKYLVQKTNKYEKYKKEKISSINIKNKDEEKSEKNKKTRLKKWREANYS